MAFERLGIGGVLTFDDRQAVRAMGRTNRLFGQLKKSAHGLRDGMSRVGQGMRSLAIAGAGVGLGIGIATKQAADFEYQMSAVKAIGKTTRAEFKAMEDKAVEMGIRSVFSATENAKALELLRRKGFDVKQSLAGLAGVSNIAAAEQVNMATAADIAAGTLRSVGKSATQLTAVADVLALTSSRSATSMTTLGESFAYGGLQAKNAGMEFEMISAVFGVLGDNMILGSRAGTSLNAVVRGLTGSTRAQRQAMAELGISIKKDFGGNLKNMPAIIDRIKRSLEAKYEKPVERIAHLNKLFGARGVVAFQALAKRGGTALRKFAGELGKASTMTEKGIEGTGASAIMAAKRLDNMKGAMTLLKSSFEAFSIVTMKPFLKGTTSVLRTITTAFNNLILTVRALGADDSMENQKKLAEKYGSTTVQIAMGIRDALKIIRETIGRVREAFRRLGTMIGSAFGGDTVRQIVKFIVLAAAILAAIAPIIASLGVAKFMIGALWKVASGVLLMLKAALLPVAIAVGVIALLFLALRKDGESFGQTFLRIFKKVLAFATTLYKKVLLPIGIVLLRGILGFVDQIKGPLSSVLKWVGKAIGDIAKLIYNFTVGIKGFWIRVASFIGTVFRTVGKFIADVIKGAMAIIRPLWALVISVFNKLRPYIVAFIDYMMYAYKQVMILIGKIGEFAKAVGKWIGAVIDELRPVIVWIFRVVGKLIAWLIPIFKWLIGVIAKVMGMLIDLATYVVKKITPVLKSFVEGLKAVVNAAYSVGNAIKKGIIWVIKKMAKFLAWIADKLAYVAWAIPGVSAKQLTKMASVLRAFGEEGILGKAVAAGVEGARARRPTMMQVMQPYSPEGQFYQSTRRTAEKRERRERTRAAKKPCVDVNFKHKSKVDTTVKIGNEQVAKSVATHHDDIRERAGFATKPWQKRAVKARSAVLPFRD